MGYAKRTQQQIRKRGLPGSDKLIHNQQAYPGSLKETKMGRLSALPIVQLNGSDESFTSATSYKPALLDIDSNTGVLKVTSTAGSNGGDNNLVNGLRTTFDRAGKAMITTKLLSDLSYLSEALSSRCNDLANDVNFSKLVARALPNGGGGVGLEF